MTPADWQRLIALLEGVGLRVVAIDKAHGRMTVQVPKLRGTT